MEQVLLEAQLDLENLLELVQKARALEGKLGFKTALSRVRKQAMCTRKNLKELRVHIVEEVKKKGEK